MRIFETNCILFITGYEVLFEVFHNDYWSESAQIMCIPTAKITSDQWSQLLDKGVPEKVKKAEYIIAEI